MEGDRIVTLGHGSSADCLMFKSLTELLNFLNHTNTVFSQAHMSLSSHYFGLAFPHLLLANMKNGFVKLLLLADFFPTNFSFSLSYAVISSRMQPHCTKSIHRNVFIIFSFTSNSCLPNDHTSPVFYAGVKTLNQRHTHLCHRLL